MTDALPVASTAPAAAPTGERSRITPAMLITLALLASIAPFATDLYLSAFPAMMSDLSTTASGVQFSLTAFLVGAGAGQVIFGPLSDRIGRRLPLLIGIAIYVVASFVAVFAPTIEVLVAARLVQGLSGAAGMVIGRAVISDLARGAAAARAMSVMMLIGALAPIAAPFVGSLLAPAIGWRGLLTIVGVVGIIAVPLVLMFVGESHPRFDRNAGGEARAFVNTAGVRVDAGKILSRRYLGYALTFAFAFATMMAYISASPFIYQTMMGLTEVQYGIAFGLNAVAMAIAGAVSARLVGRVTPQALTAVGLTLNIVAIAVFAVLAFSSTPPLWLALPLLIAVGSLGLVVGNTTALALDAVPSRSGTASAWLGCLQFVLAGIVSPIVGIAGEDTAVPTALTMLAASAVAVGAFFVATRR